MKRPGAQVARILFIDDEAGICRIASRVLAEQGHQITVAGDGRSGLELLRESGAELIMVDLHMPEMDGIEVLLQLRALAPGLPVIVMSGEGSQRLADRFPDLCLQGAVGVLAKPFGPVELVECVALALQSIPRRNRDEGQARA